MKEHRGCKVEGCEKKHYAKGLMDGCECGGSGTYLVNRGHHEHERLIDCEKCAPIRELELCWHETIVTHHLPTGDRLGEWENHWKCSCGKTGVSLGDYSAGDYVANHNALCNPNLTTALHGTVWYLRHVLEVLGLWYEFVTDTKHRDEIVEIDAIYHGNKVWGTMPKMYDILTNGTHLRDAVLSFMEEVVG